MATKPDPTKRRKPNPAQKRWGSQPMRGGDPPETEQQKAVREAKSQTGASKCVCLPWPCTPATCQRCHCRDRTQARKGRCVDCGRCKACGLAGRSFYSADDVRWVETGHREAS